MNKIRRSLAFATGKGGVGKTLLSASCGALWAEAGHRTLVVDCDAQGSATRTLGIGPESAGNGVGLYDALVRGDRLRTVPSPGRDGLHVVPAGLETRHVETSLVTMGDGPERFVDVFNALDGRWDRIVFDLPPSVVGQRLSEVVLACTEFLVAPCTSSPDDIEGLRALSDLINTIRADVNWLGVALVRIPVSATRQRRETMDKVRLMLNGRAEPFSTIVRTAGAAYFQAREKQMLPHEYGRWAESVNMSVGDRIKSGSAPPSNTAGLKEDLEALAPEMWERLAEGDSLLGQIADQSRAA